MDKVINVLESCFLRCINNLKYVYVYDLEIAFLGIYLKEIIRQVDKGLCKSIFSAV